MAAQWLDDNLRGQLEHKREELRGQIEDLERVLDGHKATPEARIVRAGRRPMSEEARKRISRRMRAAWKERKRKKQGTP